MKASSPPSGTYGLPAKPTGRAACGKTSRAVPRGRGWKRSMDRLVRHRHTKGAATDRPGPPESAPALYPTNDVPGMSRISEAGIHQRLWPTHRPPVYPLRVRPLYAGCAALSSAPAILAPSQGYRRAGQINGDIFRYAHLGTPCAVGTGVFSHTACFTGVLKTRAVIPGNDPLRLGPRGIEGGRGHGPSEDLLRRLCLMKGQKSS
jgi:hypothetical protein